MSNHESFLFILELNYAQTRIRLWDGVLESGPWENEGRAGYERPEVEWAARQWKNLERVSIAKWWNPYLTYIKQCVGSPVPQKDK